jgi:crotonobetainyl-CoA:carnitine CoA-transferase CaiB-like acyl-CoA transferase
MVREIIDPAFDKPVLHPGVVPRINGSPDGIRWPGPSIGAHSEDILREFLGLDDAAIAALRDARAVA